MDNFEYKDNQLYCEGVAVAEVAQQVGTPFYLYSSTTLTNHFKKFVSVFADIPQITCFAVKACSNLAILCLFGKLGGGADIVSGGELFRALQAGIDPQKIIYSGVGKTREELAYGLESGILVFNVESFQELDRLQNVAEGMGVRAPVSFRINPDVDPKTHSYISTGLSKNKFGIPIEEAEEIYARAAGMANIEIKGVSCHIGSQLTELSPFVEALRKVRGVVDRLTSRGITISYLDLGGGVGIRYQDEAPPELEEYSKALSQEMTGIDCTLILEPGRVIVGNAGIMVTRVQYTKQNKAKKFIIVDAAMNDLTRPSLYGAFHDIQAVDKTREQEREVADMVGPICETGDFLAKDRELPQFKGDDLVAVMSAGAYGFTMSSNYNSRPRVAEVLVNGENSYVIRKRETLESLIAGEKIPAFLE